VEISRGENHSENELPYMPLRRELNQSKRANSIHDGSWQLAS
jgi:hypothetical protein